MITVRKLLENNPEVLENKSDILRFAAKHIYFYPLIDDLCDEILDIELADEDIVAMFQNQI